MKIGWGELLVILVIAFLVVGPDKLPKLGEYLGKSVRAVKKYVNETARELDALDEIKNVRQDIESIQKDVAAMGKELENSVATAGAEIVDLSQEKEAPAQEAPAEENPFDAPAEEQTEKPSETDNT